MLLIPLSYLGGRLEPEGTLGEFAMQELDSCRGRCARVAKETALPQRTRLVIMAHSMPSFHACVSVGQVDRELFATRITPLYLRWTQSIQEASHNNHNVINHSETVCWVSCG